MPVIPKGYIITDKCCDKTRFYDTLADFPETGLVSRLYVDRETGIVYVWDGSEYITADGDIINTKVVYVDAGSGDNTTALRGYRNKPFQTLNAAIAAIQDGDTLHVFPGDYTSSVSTTKAFHIYCENGVNWTYTVRLATTLTNPQKLNWTFDTLKTTNNNNTNLFFISGTNFELDFKVNYLLNVAIQTGSAVSNIEQINFDIETAKNSYIIPGTVLSSATQPVVNLKIKNVILSSYSNAVTNFQHVLNATYNINIGNVQISGGNLTNQAVLTNFANSDNSSFKSYYVEINNINALSISAPTISSVFSGISTWHFSQINQGLGQIARVDLRYNDNNIKYIINNGVFYRNGIGIGGYSGATNTNIYIKLTGRFIKGVPVFMGILQSITNCTIYLDLDLVVNDSTGVFIGPYAAGNANNDIASGNKILITGRIQSTRAGFPCITVQGLTNSTINLKDLTLINDGTVSSIMTSNASPENILIQNVVTNSLVVDANITEVGQSIIRNANYK